jgi:hypothetical protein
MLGQTLSVGDPRVNRLKLLAAPSTAFFVLTIKTEASNRKFLCLKSGGVLRSNGQSARPPAASLDLV